MEVCGAWAGVVRVWNIEGDVKLLPCVKFVSVCVSEEVINV